MVKKRDLERELRAAGWVKMEGGGNHDKFRKGAKAIPVPRHTEIKDTTADGIRKQAGLK